MKAAEQRAGEVLMSAGAVTQWQGVGLAIMRSRVPSQVLAQLRTTINSALHPSGVAKSNTSFARGKGGNVTSAGWQVTLCDPIWHVSSRSGVAT